MQPKNDLLGCEMPQLVMFSQHIILSLHFEPTSDAELNLVPLALNNVSVSKENGSNADNKFHWTSSYFIVFISERSNY